MTISYLREMLARSDKPTIVLLREKVKAVIAEWDEAESKVDELNVILKKNLEDLKNVRAKLQEMVAPSISFTPPNVPEPPPPVIDDKAIVKAVMRAYERDDDERPPASAVVEEIRKVLGEMK